MNWLELLDEKGRVVGRRPADALPCTIGRDAENALVASIPGLAGRHAEVVRDENQTIVVRDLGSETGVRRPGSDEKVTEAQLEPGGAVLLGEARLRLVAELPASAPATAPPTEAVAPAWVAWSANRRVKLAAPPVLFAGAALVGWLVSTDDKPVQAGLFIGTAALLAEGVWVSGWALVNRLRYGAARFGQHFAVGVAGSAAGLVLGQIAGWAGFLLPSSNVATAVTFATLAALWWIALTLHLRVMRPAGSRAATRGAVVASLLLGGCITWAPALDPTDFSTSVDFSVELKPLPAELVPAATPDRLVQSLAGLKDELLADSDSLAPRRPGSIDER